TSRENDRYKFLTIFGKDDMTNGKPANMPDQIRHYINGEFVDSIDGDTFDVINPVTNQTYIKASSGKVADIDAAVAAPKEAFDNGPWPNRFLHERSGVLHKIASIVDTRQQAPAERVT